jgi:hypothetical protein
MAARSLVIAGAPESQIKIELIRSAGGKNNAWRRRIREFGDRKIGIFDEEF